jgi:hypothetical protein
VPEMEILKPEEEKNKVKRVERIMPKISPNCLNS